ncbi:MAG: hypothetical protein ACRC5M_06625 [Anaeroplasmataceae bacterium]
MAVENYFLSREGRILVNKTLKFLRSLIIKMEPESNIEETKETYLNWLAYKYAYEGNDDIYSYEYSMETCISADIPSYTVRAKQLLDKEICFKLFLEDDPDAIRLLKYLRRVRISSYVEGNTYYAQFLGFPRIGQEIKVTNKDKQTAADSDFVYLHEVNISDYPLTYEYVYIEGIVNTIRDEHPEYYYIKYMVDKKSVYAVRNTEQFDIIDYDPTILSEIELNKFFEIYNKKKIYMQRMMYVEGYSDRMNMYPFLMEVLLLQDVFVSFFNSFMDNFALANYSDQEIFDILDSYNLSSLKKVKIGTLRKIIREIPDLIELKGSEQIIEKILDIVSDDSVTIKRYYLDKIYPIGSDGQTKYDTNKIYEENVDIVFREKIIRKGTNAQEEGVENYTSFVEDDDTWGGDLAGMASSDKARVKDLFKKELMQMDFSKILTKYLTISSTVNSYSKQVKMQNYLGLLWQFIRKRSEDNFLVEDIVYFESFGIRAIDLYAAICWFNQYLNGLAEPERIQINNMNIANVMALHDSGVSSLVEDVTGNNLMSDNPNFKPPATIRLPKGFSDIKIVDILGVNDTASRNTNPEDPAWPYYQKSDGNTAINYNSVYVSFDETTTIGEIFADYNKNAAIIDAIKRKWLETASLPEARSWEYILKQNHTNTYFSVMFDNRDRFDTVISENSPDFYNYLSLSLDSGDYDVVFATYGRMLDAFKEYMLEVTNGVLILSTADSDDDENSLEYLNDLKLLFNEFLSIYTDLHKIEYSQTLSDEPYNRVRMFYHFNMQILYDYFAGKAIMSDKISKDQYDYTYLLEMMKKQKIKSLTTQIEGKEKDLEDFENINVMHMNQNERDDFGVFINKRINKLLFIQKQSERNLSGNYKNEYNLCMKIKTLLAKEGNIFYKDVLSLSAGKYTGEGLYKEYSIEEIETLKIHLNKVKERNDERPFYKIYVKEDLFENYVERIILYYVMSSEDQVVNFTDKIYMGENLKFLKDYLEYVYEGEKIKLTDIMHENDLSFVIYLRDELIKARYKRIGEFIAGAYFESPIIRDYERSEYSTISGKDSISIIDNYLEGEEGYQAFVSYKHRPMKYVLRGIESGSIFSDSIKMGYDPTQEDLQMENKEKISTREDMEDDDV